MPSITLTFDAAGAARIAKAMGQYLGLGRDATVAEVKADFIERLRYIVVEQEKAAAAVALTEPATPVVT